MKNIFLIFITVVAVVFASCSSKDKKGEDLNGAHKVIVKEVLQANAYTYLNVTENETDQWIAVAKMDAKVGDVFYYNDFMEMKYFESKDLGRTFESVYFIENLRSSLEMEMPMNMQMPEGHVAVEGQKPNIVKEELKIEPVEGGITIAELFTNRKKYDGKKIIIRGKIVKVNHGIMNKSWYHIQDGTSADDNFDLTVTSLNEEIKENDIVTFEGKIILNKDFGYGYSYEVLLEDAITK